MSDIYKYVNRLANSQRRLIDNLATGREYSGAQGKVIHYLFNNKERPVYQKEIEKIFGLRASTATELLNSLVRMGLIKRVPNQEDGRYKEIILTDQADQYKEDVFHDVERLEATLRCGISDEEAATWQEISQKILACLERKEQENET